jgi:DNA-binding CsgD family transcriptional regulator
MSCHTSTSGGGSRGPSIKPCALVASRAFRPELISRTRGERAEGGSLGEIARGLNLDGVATYRVAAGGGHRRCVPSSHVRACRRLADFGTSSCHDCCWVTSVEIVGRDAELRSVSAFLDRTGEGPAALMLDGEAGIGKSTLWLAGVEAARERGFRVLSARPAEVEQGLAHAGLGDLFEGVLESVVPALSVPRRRALEVALLVEPSAGRSVDPRTLGVALRNAVEVLAAGGPVVLAVDDVQWLDLSSAGALAFAVRRLGKGPVLLLLARRVGEGAETSELERALDAERVERLPVGPLSLGALHRLLRSRLGRTFGRSTLLQVYETSGGNPFFALELARALERRLEPAAGEPLPVPAQLEALLARRLADLPPGAVEVLRLAGALARPTLGLIEAAAGSDVGVALRPAIEAGLVALDGDRVRFTHPLFPLAVASQLTPDKRRELHGRLAAVVNDVEQRARHLALATEGPDEEVAAALEAAAEAAAARGGWAAAAELYEFAGWRTPRGALEGSRRRLRASRIWDEVGDDARALRLVEPLASELPPGPERARALMQLSYLSTDLAEGVKLGEEALLQPGLDDALSAEIHNEQANNYGLLLELASARSHAAAAVEHAERTGDPALLAQSLAFHLNLEHVAGNPGSDHLVRRSLALEHDAGERPHFRSPTWAKGQRLYRAGWLDEARSLHDDYRRRAQDYGLDALDAQSAYWLVWLECQAGRLGEAERLLSEYSGSFGEESGGRHLGVGAAGEVATYAGRLEEARALFAEGAELAARGHLEDFRLLNLARLAFVDLSLGDARAALDRLSPLVDRLEEKGYRHPGFAPVLPEAIEAAIAVGWLDIAGALVARLERQARTLAEPWPLAVAARSRALLAAATGDFEASFEAFASALAEHKRIPMPFEHARTLLALGAAQRRAKRRAEARASLQQALRIFQELGTPVWAEKAHAELGGIGGRAREKGLTPAESRVAALVAEGRTNREVAAALFLGERTVETHLTHIYAKLGVRSRTELARRLR